MQDEYIIIGADIVPTKTNESLFVKGDAKELLGDGIISILNSASFRILNLEVPLTNEKNPILKYGPNLIASEETINGLRMLNIDLFSLANNHILDQGVKGLRRTKELLRLNGIEYVGAGENVAEASKPYIFAFANRRIGVYACAEHEFSIAEEDKPGANPFDPLWSLEHIRELKKNTDYIIVLYHGGREHYRYPSPMLQKTCHRMIDYGADLIICQHSHCIGCQEKYQNGSIIYGQGNFLFDYEDDECWQTGLLVSLDASFTIEFIPIVKNGNCVRLASSNDKDRILYEFDKRSEEIMSPGKVEALFDDYALNNLNSYLGTIHGRESLFFRLINRISNNSLLMHKIKKAYGLHHLSAIKNYMMCETHREIMIQAISSEMDIADGENDKKKKTYP